MITRVIVLLSLINNWCICQKQSECDIQFTCKDSNLTEVFFEAVKMLCPNDLLCNKNYEKTLVEGTLMCQPCIETAKVCTLGFKCDTIEEVFTLNGLLYKCPADFSCNRDLKESCAPCIAVKCDKELWTCDPLNPIKVTQDHSSATCQSGFACNKDYLGPCVPCIKASEGISTTTLPPETNHSSATTAATPHSNFSMETTLNSSQATSSTVSNGTTSLATTTAPPFKVPDCNDGMGYSRPCRPGPPGRFYYYRCKYYSSVWLDYEIRYCKNLNYDPRCQGFVCLQ